ncbi:signal peptidase II [Gemelliphila palaticanis]|uniref:Lipoprotein signal peptidase n=1 Tax=Gemelliphila palaticanis TaxID=81950 RepID=A0ABX2SYX5_9BACL|nr:signal peptidase II [Gemella palaticanis]MBF0715323.1 signal peptidase II [Gemella palaticanis]NYS47253.1 signal peptidase II [Gemella palaticanis]
MIFILLATILLIAFDQITKYLILSNFKLGESLLIIDNFFSITSHRNRGAAWGILEDSRLFFIVITSIFLIGMLIYLLKNKANLSFLDKITFALIMGGAIGNFIDRIKTGEVVDFLDFKIFNYNFPIFNIADICICIGVFLLVIKIYRED